MRTRQGAPNGLERQICGIFYTRAAKSVRRAGGFSLLEIVIAISIGAILLAVGIPVLRHNQDTRNLEASATRLQSFLSDACKTSKEKNCEVVLRAQGGTSFDDCAEVSFEFVGAGSTNKTFTPNDGIRLRGGPSISCLVFLAGGDLDCRGSGYLGLQGTYPDHLAYVTFNTTGAINRSPTQPSSQVSSATVGAETLAQTSNGGAVGPTGQTGGGVTAPFRGP
mgnify:CR=1 FL=1